MIEGYSKLDFLGKYKYPPLIYKIRGGFAIVWLAENDITK